MLRFYISFLEWGACKSMSLYFSYFPHISISVHSVSILFQDLSQQDYVKGFQLLTYFLPLLLSLKMYSQGINVIMFIHILNKSQFSTFYSQGIFQEGQRCSNEEDKQQLFCHISPPQEFHQPGKTDSCHWRGDQKQTPHRDTLSELSRLPFILLRAHSSSLKPLLAPKGLQPTALSLLRWYLRLNSKPLLWVICFSLISPSYAWGMLLFTC